MATMDEVTELFSLISGHHNMN